jgi:hypothetical protein
VSFHLCGAWGKQGKWEDQPNGLIPSGCRKLIKLLAIPGYADWMVGFNELIVLKFDSQKIFVKLQQRPWTEAHLHAGCRQLSNSYELGIKLADGRLASGMFRCFK